MTKENTLQQLINVSGCKTQKEFAKKHGKGEVQVSEWLLGKKKISDSTLSEIAKAEGYVLSINYQLEKL